MTTPTPVASGDRYTPVAIFLHWTIALLIGGAWLLVQARGMFPHEVRAPVMDLHKSLGLTVFALVLLRMIWRVFNPAPALPKNTRRLVRLAAHAGHAALYLLMLAVPLAGMLMTWSAGRELPVYGLFGLPAPIPLSPDFKDTLENIHGILGNTIIWLAGLHAAAALGHQYVLKDGLLDRMLPARLRSARSGKIAI